MLHCLVVGGRFTVEALADVGGQGRRANVIKGQTGLPVNATVPKFCMVIPGNK